MICDKVKCLSDMRTLLTSDKDVLVVSKHTEEVLRDICMLAEASFEIHTFDPLVYTYLHGCLSDATIVLHCTYSDFNMDRINNGICVVSDLGFVPDNYTGKLWYVCHKIPDFDIKQFTIFDYDFMRACNCGGYYG